MVEPARELRSRGVTRDHEVARSVWSDPGGHGTAAIELTRLQRIAEESQRVIVDEQEPVGAGELGKGRFVPSSHVHDALEQWRHGREQHEWRPRGGDHCLQADEMRQKWLGTRGCVDQTSEIAAAAMQDFRARFALVRGDTVRTQDEALVQADFPSVP